MAQTYKETEIQRDIHTEKQRARQADSDRQTEIQKDRHTDLQT